MIPAYRQRNYFQSALYVIIASIAATILLERLLTYAEAAEKAAMEVTLSQLRASIYTKVAFLALKGDYGAIEALSAQSPFLVAQARAPNYQGEFDGMPVEAKGGNWFFDRARHELVYVPNLTRYLTPESGKEQLRFRLAIHKHSESGYTGVSLLATTVFAWTPIR